MKLGLKPGQSRAERKQHLRGERDRLALEMFKVACQPPQIPNTLYVLSNPLTTPLG